MGGGASHPVTTTEQSKTSIPRWMSASSQQTLGQFDRAIKRANRGGGALTEGTFTAGESMVADLDPLQSKGIGDIEAHAFDYQPALSQGYSLLDPSNFDTEINFGTGMSRSVGPDGKTTINFDEFTPETMQRYQSPYTSS